MTVPPHSIFRSALGKLLESNEELKNTLLSAREIASRLSTQTQRLVPNFTDHTVEHMDELWAIADAIFTLEEIQQFTVAEAFALGMCFYLHDLGMAVAATPEGLSDLTRTDEFKRTLNRYVVQGGLSPEASHLLAIESASREHHASNAQRLACDHIPGIDIHLIESQKQRLLWGDLLGKISSSHHWNLAVVDQHLGKIRFPTEYGVVDAAFVACALRIIDFAHINRGRAPRLERAFRATIKSDSSLHWDAQQNIVGPLRENEYLSYTSTAPLPTVDSWWLFYDMAMGLDTEIRSVREYLSDRHASHGRFSLVGVRSVESLEAFATRIHLPDGVQPVDVRVQPDSMERLVSLLGGAELYANDKLAPLRELLQNARDAIELRRSLPGFDIAAAAPPLIKISRETEGTKDYLIIEDNGVGMNKVVLVKYLIGVASQFWKSIDFSKEFEDARKRGFQPIGRFGIGFLSVFMIGDEIEVETARADGPKYKLVLHGVGRRGELHRYSSSGWSGTRIPIQLKADAVPLFANLLHTVQSRAPLLAMRVEVKQSATDAPAYLEPGWAATATEPELKAFLRGWVKYAYYGGVQSEEEERRMWHYHYLREEIESNWPSAPPTVRSSEAVLRSLGDTGGSILVCAQGFAIGKFQCADLTGIIDIGAAELDASRSNLKDARFIGGMKGRLPEHLDVKVRELVRPKVVEELNRLVGYGMLPARLELLRSLASVYGLDILQISTLPWVPSLEHPGNTVFRSVQDVALRIAGKSRAVLALNIGYAGIYKKLTEEQVECIDLPIIVIPIHEVTVDYNIKEKIKRQSGRTVLIGSLDEVLKDAEISQQRFVLFRKILETTASAWAMSTEQLASQEWRLDTESSSLWAVLESKTQ